MSENAKTEIKTVKGPKAAVATFIRLRDGIRIYVYPRAGETREHAVSRVISRNGGSKEGAYEYCN